MIQNTYCSVDFVRKHGGVFIEHIIANHDISYVEYGCCALIYIAHGKGKFYIDNTNCSVEEGDIFLINPYCPLCSCTVFVCF